MAFLSDPYTGPLVFAFFWQIAMLFFCALGGPPELFMPAAAYTSAGFWVGVVMVLVRRPRNPTAGDLKYFRWGLPVAIVVGGCIAMWYWCRFRGALDRKSVV